MINELSMNTIIDFEVGSPAAYSQFYQVPVWPGGESGVTIGIGYDLGYMSLRQFKDDWGEYLSPANIVRLQSFLGVKGLSAKARLPFVKDIVIAYTLAKKVFVEKTIPKYEASMLSIYPEAKELPADTYGMLVSLVYNRGTSLVGDRRKEMKAIQELVKNKDVHGIASQVLAMCRLWDSKKAGGLIKRRIKEAGIIRASQ
jgi:GH24 family phage-related lysozyme (muramidase)